MQKPGQEIKVARLSKGISIETLAAYADIPVKELVLIENSFKIPNHRQLFRLATLLSIPHAALNLDLGEVEAEISAMPDFESLRAGVPASPSRDPRLVLIIGQFYNEPQPFHHTVSRDQKKVRVVGLPSANQSFAYLGIGTKGQTGHHTPTYIILDTEIQYENYLQTTQAFHSVRRLQHVPVFLSSSEPSAEVYRLSNRNNVYGSLTRPTSPEDYQAQLIDLLSKVERLNDFI